MDNRSDNQFLIIQATIGASRQDSDDKMKKQDYKIDKFKALSENIMVQIKISNYSPDNIDSQ